MKTGEKTKVSRSALFFIKNGMTVGIGDGNTVRIFVNLLGKKIRREKLKIKVVPVSERIRILCRKNRLKIAKKPRKIDLAVDGADRIDDDFNVLKGFGAFEFVREKKLDYKAEKLILIADSRKFVKNVLNYPILVQGKKKPKADFIKHSSRMFKNFYKVWIDKEKIKNWKIGKLEDRLEGIGGCGLFTKIRELVVIGIGKKDKRVFIKPREKFFQVAVDIADEKKALNLIKKVEKYVDIIEFGTPLVKLEGLDIIKKFKSNKLVMADMKTSDTGSYEAALALKAGADIISILAGSSNETIIKAIRTVRKAGKKVLVDLIDVKPRNRVKRLKEILNLKYLPDIVCIHVAIDVQGKGMQGFLNIGKLVNLCKDKKVGVALAGGLNINKIKKLKKYEPDVFIVGGAITKAKNPVAVAKQLKKLIKGG